MSETRHDTQHDVQHDAAARCGVQERPGTGTGATTSEDEMTNTPEHRPQRDEQPTPATPTQESSTFDLPELEPKPRDPSADDEIKGGRATYLE